MIQPPSYLTNPECRRWLLWRSITQKQGKPKKVPFYVNGARRNGQLDSEIDLKQLVSYQEAKAAFEKGDYTGLGFALGPDGKGGHWQGIDLDDITNSPELRLLSLPGYVELSPSLQGFHAIGYGRRFKALGSNGSGVEAYCAGRYFTFTGYPVRKEFSDETIDLADYVENELLPLHGKGKSQEDHKQRQARIDAMILSSSTSLIAELRSALSILSADDYDEWISVGQALFGLGDEGRQLWKEWSVTSPKFQGEDDLKKWATFKGDRTGYRAIFKKAYSNGWKNDHLSNAPDLLITKQSNDQKTIISEWSEVNVADIFLAPPEPLQFLIDQLLPRSVLTLLGAHGGVGKSILALQAAVCLAVGMKFMDKNTVQSRVLFYSAEDAGAIIRGRLFRIFRHMGLDPVVVSKNLKIIDTTENPVLFSETNVNGVRQGLLTNTYHALCHLVESSSTDVIIVDNASDTFDANENERARVREFVRSLVRIGRSRNIAVLLLAHIDKQTAKGFGNTEGYSGSTAWHNSARSRLFLIKEENEDITLKHQKSNHGILAKDVIMRWTSDGVLLNVALPDEESTLDKVVSLIKKHYDRGNYISTSHTSSMNASIILRSDPEFPTSIRGNKELWSLLSMAEDRRLLVRREIPAKGRSKTRQIYAPASTAPTCSDIAGAVNTDPTPSSVPSTTGVWGRGASQSQMNREVL